MIRNFCHLYLCNSPWFYIFENRDVMIRTYLEHLMLITSLFSSGWNQGYYINMGASDKKRSLAVMLRVGRRHQQQLSLVVQVSTREAEVWPTAKQKKGNRCRDFQTVRRLLYWLFRLWGRGMVSEEKTGIWHSPVPCLHQWGFVTQAQRYKR